PFVLVDPVGGSDPTMPTVAASNWAGGLAATEHLLELGPRRIGIVTGPAALPGPRDRLDGCRAALRGARLAATADLVRSGDFMRAGGRRGASELLSLADPP